MFGENLLNSSPKEFQKFHERINKKLRKIKTKTKRTKNTVLKSLIPNNEIIKATLYGDTEMI